MVVSSTLTACSYFIHSLPGAKVSPSPYGLHTHARKVSTSIKIIASVQFRTILIWSSTYESFQGTVSLSVEHGWSSRLSSRIESGFLPDSFLSLYSDGGNHTRVFVVPYAHGRILSHCWFEEFFGEPYSKKIVKRAITIREACFATSGMEISFLIP